jgi:signal-transduction protein with cAMP-binding, CBS, and nucleotidyltransferase domain
MKVSDVAVRGAVTAAPDATLEDIAVLMTREGVGSVVIVDHHKLVGIVTDRDLVTRGLARHLPADARADAVMSMNVVAIDLHADIRDAVAAFGHHAVRRMPVVDGSDVVGLVSLDDLVVALSGAFSECARGLTAQLLFPHAADPAPTPALR